jgi:hypothetical protein
MWSILTFGKYKGKSLPEVILQDPDWFFRAIENHVLEKRGFARRPAISISRPVISKFRGPPPNTGTSTIFLTTVTGSVALT